MAGLEGRSAYSGDERGAKRRSDGGEGVEQAAKRQKQDQLKAGEPSPPAAAQQRRMPAYPNKKLMGCTLAAEAARLSSQVLRTELPGWTRTTQRGLHVIRSGFYLQRGLLSRMVKILMFGMLQAGGGTWSRGRARA